jgi:thiamine pyrophosphate-dependent acetolactate synthase large subunit-like protein
MYIEKELPEGVEYKIDDAGRSVLIMSQKLLPPTALALLGDKGYVLDGTENRLQKEMFGATFTKWDSAVAKRKKRKKRKEKRARAKARKYKYVIASRSWDKPKEN